MARAFTIKAVEAVEPTSNRREIPAQRCFDSFSPCTEKHGFYPFK